MKVLYLLLVLTLPLINGLFNNNTDAINSSTCHNPYLGETGDNWSARSYVDYHNKILKIFDRNKIICSILQS